MRQLCGFFAEIAVADNGQRSAACCLHIEGRPLAFRLAVDHAPEIFRKKQRRRQHEFSQGLAEYAAAVGQQRRTFHKLREQQPIQSGRARMHPLHSWRDLPNLLHELPVAGPVEEDLRFWREPFKRFDTVAHCD